MVGAPLCPRGRFCGTCGAGVCTTAPGDLSRRGNLGAGESMRAKSVAARSGVSLLADAPIGRGDAEYPLIVTGIDGGSLEVWNQGDANISSKLGRDLGLVWRIEDIRSLAASDNRTVSGKLYWLQRILRYVVFTSEVSKGGLPTSIV